MTKDELRCMNATQRSKILSYVEKHAKCSICGKKDVSFGFVFYTPDSSDTRKYVTGITRECLRSECGALSVITFEPVTSANLVEKQIKDITFDGDVKNVPN